MARESAAGGGSGDGTLRMSSWRAQNSPKQSKKSNGVQMDLVARPKQSKKSKLVQIEKTINHRGPRRTRRKAQRKDE